MADGVHGADENFAFVVDLVFGKLGQGAGQGQPTEQYPAHKKEKERDGEFCAEAGVFKDGHGAIGNW
jgi:hypothetical protein